MLLLGLATATLLSGKRGCQGGRERYCSCDYRCDCGVPSTHLTGVAAATLRIKAYNATGELDITNNNPFTLGTTVLLTCDVTGLPQGDKVVSYRWYHNCTSTPNSGCEIQDGDPYYRVVNDTLLLDVTSWDQGGRYYCTVHYLQEANPIVAVTRISVAGLCTHYK